jgi:hypothetical protein
MARVKFYGNGMIWDAKKDRALLKFEKHAGGSMYLGALIVEDDYIIERMEELGYKKPENEGVLKMGGWEALADSEAPKKRGRKKKEAVEDLPTETENGETVE